MNIDSVSSVNLRKKVGMGCKLIDDEIFINCSGCEKKKFLGKDTCVIVKVRYSNSNETKEVHMCDICTDIFIDLLRYGKHVIYSDWKRKSFTKRMTSSKSDSYCFKCFNSSTSHIYFKFISEQGIESSDRVCANCACMYLEILDDADFSEFEYPFISDSDTVSYAGGRI